MNDLDILLGAIVGLFTTLSGVVVTFYQILSKRINKLEAKNEEQIKMIIQLTEKVGKYEGEREIADKISKKIDDIFVLIKDN